MAIGKICGIETEYGIVHRGVVESNPVTASSLLINAYVADLAVTAAAGDRARAGITGFFVGKPKS